MPSRPALPEQLRARLAELDPARDPMTERPDLNSLIGRADAANDAAPRTDVLDLVPHTESGRRSTVRLAVAAACLIAVAAGVLTGLLLTGNSASRTANSVVPHGTAALLGVTWVDHDADADLVFRPASIEISYGCERLYYALVLTPTRIHQGKQVPPSLVCPSATPPAPGSADYPAWLRTHRAQDSLFRILSSGPSWAVTGGTLVLTGSSEATATLTRKSTASIPLAGSSWRLSYYTTVGGVFGNSAAVRLSFGAHTIGLSSTRAVCTTFFGQAAIGDATVTLSRLEYAGEGCSEDLSSTVRNVSQTVDTLMQGTVAYTIDNNTLRLTKPGSKAVLGFVPAG